MLLRGQGATELIVLLAMIVIVGLVIYASSQTRLSESRKIFIVSQARAAVNDLASAASEVYSEGAGAKRKVYITIPEGANPARVYVNNTMINIGLNLDSGSEMDINTQTTMKVVQGADFPTTPGTYWVYVTAKEGYVLIGNSNFNINPQSLSLVMPPSNSTNSTITFTNVGAVPIAVNLSLEWSYGGTVDVSLNTTNFAIFPSDAGATVYVLVTAQTYSNTSLRSYAGRIVVSTNTTERGDIGLSINVAGSQPSTGVSSIVIDTFKNSSYSTMTTNFTLPKMVNINGSGWNNDTVTLNIQNASGNTAYTTNLTVPVSGNFTYAWNPAGVSPGNYTVAANQSATSRNTTFNITVCP
jgi:hypothetical protein